MAKHEGAPRPHHRIEADEAAHLSARRRQHAANQVAHRARAEQANQAERAARADHTEPEDASIQAGGQDVPVRRETVITPQSARAAQDRKLPAGSTSRFERVPRDQGFVAEQGMLERREQRRNRPRKPLGRRGRTIAGAIALVAVLLLTLAWTHRPVEVFVNGSRRTYNAGTTLEQIRQKEGVETRAGNLVSVSGEVLQKGKGNAWSVEVNGEKLSFSEAGSHAIGGGEKIVFGDGEDVCEEYTTKTVEVQPRLVFDGAAGSVTYVSQWGKVGKKEVRTGQVSGEVVDGKTITKVQDCVLTIKNPTPAGGKKLVALTFDDGPSEYTERYLKILKEHGAKATFFNLGQCADEYPALEKKIVEAGHQLCSHTYSHDQLTADSDKRIASEITSAFDSIEKNSGQKTTVIRPPYGAIDSKVWLATKGTVSTSVLWNMDSRDWALPGVDAIVQNCVSGIQPGYVILMHDGGGNRDQDLEALPKIIDQLHEQGYEFVTISELMASDDSIPDEACSGDATMPTDAVWPTEVGEG